ncbi:hypothetical protein AYO22_02020 [Fonsecaea multimorphosa]|nr:hypothetical protein AYO22_02020 [Fonsecaea multimorphosa]
MTKKKRHHPDVEEVLARPWCYYCERDFDDLKILINHQKAKHFKCERCGRRLNTAGGLSVHMSQVHKENLTAVDNALPNRAGLDIEIFGMEGIPEDIIQQHNQRVLTSFHQAQADRQAATGNNAANAQHPNAPKKPKIESVSDIKKRLAEHKAAKLAAEQGDGTSSGGATPNTPAATVVQAQPQVHTAASPTYPGYQQSYAAPPTNGSYSQSPSFAQPPATLSAPYQASPIYPPAGSPPAVEGYGQHSATPQPGQPGYGQIPYSQPPYAQPPQPSFQPPQPSPVGYPPQPSFSPPQYQSPYPGQPYPAQPAGPPRPFASGSPVPGFPQPPTALAQRSHSPATNGLPQRPAFGAPPVNAFQFQQMHQGQIPAPQSHNIVPQFAPGQAPGSTNMQVPPQIPVPNQASLVEAQDASSLDDLIASASKQADADAAAAAEAAAKPAIPPAVTSLATTKDEAGEDKGGPKKDKEKEKPKATRLVYSDNETSPEEKMAMLPKYAFTPAQKTVVV